MKKLFSLVALAGMFMLMSFTFSTQKVEKVSPAAQSACEEVAMETVTIHGNSWEYAEQWYMYCLAVNDN